MINLNNYSRVTPGTNQTGYSAARLPYMTPDAASVRAAAASAGMWDQGGDHYTANDGSWVALVNGRVERGVGNQVWASIPGRQPAAASAASTASSGPPSYMMNRYIGHGDITQAVRACGGDAATLQRWVAAAPGAVTINGQSLLAQYGVYPTRTANI